MCARAEDRKRENSRLLREDLEQQREVFRSWPEVVSLHTTERCNLRCVMCTRSVRTGRRSLPRGDLARLCEELFPTARKAIVTGNQGEPMLADFDVVVDAALRHRVEIDLVTNGTLLTAERYRALEPALGLLNVSLDSHQPEVYERIRVGARFARVLSNLRGIAAVRRETSRAADLPVWSLSAVVMRSNLDHLAEFVGFTADVGADAAILQPLRQFHRRLAREDVLDQGESDFHAGRGAGCQDPFRGRAAARARLDEHFEAARSVARARGVNLYFGDFQLAPVVSRPLEQRMDYVGDSSRHCWYAARNLSVYDTGEVYPCCHPTDYCLGNVRRHDLGTIWNGPRMRRLRRLHFTRRGSLFCSGCLHAPYLEAPAPSRLRNGVKLGRLTFNHLRNLALRPATHRDGTGGSAPSRTTP